MLRTKRSAYAFGFGDDGGGLTDATSTLAIVVQELGGK